ncbi:hypothetical protein F442_14626 [Phytophthora nicotianae P10297]|uniref:DUF7587 domain-containing protein n=2 Tax=Phytophthora nicotianae TaxID=4792 RepID=W2YRV7_PHYNI|nr:hypothetical protein L916_14273 [Phytophthora nicotianae]ETP37567.1 hypothetical protein F442_14626 [Phytophthora nicotianae P10297]
MEEPVPDCVIHRPNEGEFKKAVELHLDWYNRDPTPFVSLFDSEKHVWNWAKYHLGRRNNDIVLLKIKASELGSLFRVWYLVQCKLVQTSIRKEWYDEGFLVLRKIRRQSIIQTIHISQIENYSSEDSDITSIDSDSDSDSDVSDTVDG